MSMPILPFVYKTGQIVALAVPRQPTPCRYRAIRGGCETKPPTPLIAPACVCTCAGGEHMPVHDEKFPASQTALEKARLFPEKSSLFLKKSGTISRKSRHFQFRPL